MNSTTAGVPAGQAPGDAAPDGSRRPEATRTAPDAVAGDRRAGDDAGQTTAEYALVLLGAAAVAGVLLKWATGSSGLGKLFSTVMERLLGGIG